MTGHHLVRPCLLLLAGLALMGAAPADAKEPKAEPPKAEASRPAETKTTRTKAKRIKIIKRNPRLGWLGLSTQRGYLGVHLLEITEQLRGHYGAPKDAGLLVAKVENDSPAAAAGLRVGDVLVEVDGKPVDSTWDVARRIGKKEEGEEATLRIVRAKKVLSVKAKIRERDKAQVDVSRFIRVLPGEDEEVEIEVDTAPLEENMELLREELGALDEEERARFEESQRDLERRLEQMERKIEQLERELDDKQR